MQATSWNRKALLSAFDKAPPLILPTLALAFDLALFGAGSALALLAPGIALKLLGTKSGRDGDNPAQSPYPVRPLDPDGRLAHGRGAVAELILRIGAPGPDRAICREGHAEVAAGGDSDDIG